MNTINPLTPIPYVGSSTSQTGGQTKGQNQPQQGQSFQATVVETKPDNTFTLDIAGNRISARTEVPLSVGQTLHLQVVATSPKVELRIISDTMKQFLGHSLTLIGKNIDLTSLMSSLQKAPFSPLDTLSTSSRQTLESFHTLQQTDLTDKNGGDVLKQLVDRIGLSFEALLARGNKESLSQTLKSALLEIAHLFKGAGEIAETTNRLLGTLELYQLAQLQLAKENIFIFPLPLPFVEKGYLLIEDYKQDQDKDGEEGTDTLNFSLHLTMKELGNLRVDFLQHPEGLFLRFNCDSQEKCAFFQTYSEDLLSAHTDPPILGISFSDNAEDPASELLKHLIPDGRSIVDTKA